jgi:hypothetical protein
MTLSDESRRSHLKRARRYGSLQWFTTHNDDCGLERFDFEDLCIATGCFRQKGPTTGPAEFRDSSDLPIAGHIWIPLTPDGASKTKRTQQPKLSQRHTILQLRQQSRQVSIDEWQLTRSEIVTDGRTVAEFYQTNPRTLMKSSTCVFRWCSSEDAGKAVHGGYLDSWH